ncbi:unnamed protein product [Gordionus sp. m RMFG-2023]
MRKLFSQQKGKNQESQEASFIPIIRYVPKKYNPLKRDNFEPLKIQPSTQHKKDNFWKISKEDINKVLNDKNTTKGRMSISTNHSLGLNDAASYTLEDTSTYDKILQKYAKSNVTFNNSGNTEPYVKICLKYNRSDKVLSIFLEEAVNLHLLAKGDLSILSSFNPFVLVSRLGDPMHKLTSPSKINTFHPRWEKMFLFKQMNQQALKFEIIRLQLAIQEEQNKEYVILGECYIPLGSITKLGMGNETHVWLLNKVNSEKVAKIKSQKVGPLNPFVDPNQTQGRDNTGDQVIYRFEETLIFQIPKQVKGLEGKLMDKIALLVVLVGVGKHLNKYVIGNVYIDSQECFSKLGHDGQSKQKFIITN